MNAKEIMEIRRRYRQDKSSITHIRGCYVNENRDIISEFNQPLGLMTLEEADRFLGILKKTMSGTLGRNLFDLSFTTQQVKESEEHQLLMALRNSCLKDEAAVQAFFTKAIQSLSLEGNYLILLAYDQYDVPYRAKDGDKLEDASSEVYAYFLCSICPVKQLSPALGYYIGENEFHSRAADWIVSAPELGFTFPSFDDRCANIYSALYFTRDTSMHQEAFINAVFQNDVPMPAAVQKETFQALLAESLDTECSLGVVQAVNDELRDRIEEHKANKEEEPLVISKQVVKGVLESCGISEQRVKAFDQKFDDEFGRQHELSPSNLINTRQVVLEAPDVTIHVKLESGHLIETRVIDGKKYILIRADQGVEVNGVNVSIS